MTSTGYTGGHSVVGSSMDEQGVLWLDDEMPRPGLRRDQTWLTEKDREGATRLYPLTDFNPRKVAEREAAEMEPED